MRWAEEWWSSETEYLSKPKAVVKECDEYAEAWEAVITDWVTMPNFEDDIAVDPVEEDKDEK